MTVPSLWHRFGRLPSLGVFVGVYLVAASVVLLAAPEVRTGASIALWVAMTLYCAARPDRRMEVYGAFLAPGVIGQLLAAVTDISPLWGLVLVPFVLLSLRDVDRSPGAGHRD